MSAFNAFEWTIQPLNNITLVSGWKREKKEQEIGQHSFYIIIWLDFPQPMCEIQFHIYQIIN